MKKPLPFWQFAGFVFTGVFGMLLHFLYDITGSAFSALFSGVNESTWEHMKLLFFPMLIFAIFQSRYFAKDYNKFWCAKLIGILTGLIVIPTIYYTYKGILGISIDWFNILIFYIAAAVGFIVETRFMKSDKNFCKSPIVAIIILCIIAVLFFVFTFAPPKIPLFMDPITKTYGI
ncbi:MAG: hypothetical protein IKU82_05685 [Clostridia bacterium]|nr:hypothetical protein [Clostridia bacterium]